MEEREGKGGVGAEEGRGEEGRRGEERGEEGRGGEGRGEEGTSRGVIHLVNTAVGALHTDTVTSAPHTARSPKGRDLQALWAVFRSWQPLSFP